MMRNATFENICRERLDILPKFARVFPNI